MSAEEKPAEGSSGFSDYEKAAMKERAKELKAEEKRGKTRAAGEAAIQEKIAEMPPAERALAEKFHTLVSTHAPTLDPKTWYSMPAYARDGKIVMFFQAAAKFESRYCSIGFTDQAHLDDGSLWPVGYAIVDWNDDVEAQLTARVLKAVE